MPHESMVFWTDKLLQGAGVGQVAYPMNQSLEGLLARNGLQDSRVLWIVLAIVVIGYGLIRAARAGLAGDELTAMALTGFVGSLLSPISWVHHLFWFVPAILALVDTSATGADGRSASSRAGADGRSASSRAAGTLSGLRHRPALIVAAVLTYATVTFSMIQWWDFTLLRPGGAVGFVLSNWIVLLMLVLMPLLPIQDRRSRGRVDVRRLTLEAVAR
jgi:alpha-1,2-mannosyltransferase